MSEQPKYFIIQRLMETPKDRTAFNEMLNQALETGHRVHTFTSQYEQGEVPGIGYTRYTALMSLKSEGKYENITNLKDVSPSHVDEHLADGWVVTDTFSKFVRMVRRLKKDLNNKTH